MELNLIPSNGNPLEKGALIWRKAELTHNQNFHFLFLSK